MSENARALFFVGDVKFREKDGKKDSVIVDMHAAYKDDIPEHCRFAEFTPNGQVQITISNPHLFDFFKMGRYYYIDITKAE